MSDFIRTPTEARGELTPEETAAIAAVVQKWINIAFRTDRADPDLVETNIKALYKAAGLEEPRVVLVPSPYMARIVTGVAALIDANRKVKQFNRDFAVSKEDGSFTAMAVKAIADCVNDGRNVRTIDICSLNRSANPIVAMIREIVPKKFIPDVKEYISETSSISQGGNMWHDSAAYEESMRDVIGLTGLDCWEKYQAWEDCAKCAGFRYMHNKFCVVSDFPDRLRVNERYQPHSADGPSHRWRDGFEAYYLNGVAFDKDLYHKVIEGMSLSDVLNIKDVDQRTQALRFIDVPTFINHANGKLLDRRSKVDVEGNFVHYELYKIPQGEIFSTDAYYCLFSCPSTSKYHFEGVEKAATVAQAMAWAGDISEDEWEVQVPLVHEM